MVKDHSDSERGNLLLPHGLPFSINSKSSFYMHHPTDRIAHTTAFVTPVMEYWLEREIAQWVHHEQDEAQWYSMKLRCHRLSDQSHFVNLLSCFWFQPLVHDWCNKGHDKCYPVCWMVLREDPMLLIKRESHEVKALSFLSCYLNGP